MAENNIMNVLDLSEETKEYIATLIASAAANMADWSEETKKYIATLYPQDVSFDTRLLSIYRTLLEEQKKQPYSINLVSLIGADENAHSRVLCRLLQYPGEKATYPFAIDFISKFISPDVAEQVSVHAGRYKLEIYQEKQRMDLQLFMPGIVGIIIENKINGAEDQKDQLKRYIEEMQKRIGHPYVIYLTWDGSKTVSDKSLPISLKKSMKDTGHLKELNYAYHILPWLKTEVLPLCLYREKQLVYALEQYVEYLEIRSARRKQDQALRQAVYRQVEIQFTKEN